MLTLAQARRRSVVVKVWRVVCIGMAVLMGVSIFASAVWRLSLPGFIGERMPTVSSPRMVNPRFTGRASGDKVFVLTAESALQRKDNAQAVDLEQPSYSNGEGMNVRAPKGVYNPEKQTVDLWGGVIFTDGAGNQFSTPKAHVDARSNLASGADTLSGAGRFGDVKSKNFEISASGDTVRMSGGVSGTIKGSEN